MATQAFFSLVAGGDHSLVVVLGLLIAMASLVWILGSRPQAQELWCTDLVALRHVEFSLIRDQPRVSCIGRQILYH